MLIFWVTPVELTHPVGLCVYFFILSKKVKQNGGCQGLSVGKEVGYKGQYERTFGLMSKFIEMYTIKK